VILALVLFLAVVLTYAPVWHAGFIWDDDGILTANPCIVGPLGLKDIWTTTMSQSDVAPLTRSTFWLEHKLWGLAPQPYHVVNVLLHGLCAILLWRVLLSLRVRGAWFGAALWALHPVEAESVAWVAEMKNTESCVFFLLAILFFVDWARSRSSDDGFMMDRDYALTLLFSALALLCKASTVILPVVFCLCTWWLEGRWRWRNLLAAVPVLLMGIALSLVSMVGQKEQMATLAVLHGTRSWLERILTAGDAVWFYLGKLLAPYPLVNVYPQWDIDAGQWVSYLPLAGLILVIFLLRQLRGPCARSVLFAGAYFLIALLPVLGLAENTIFLYAPVFDHLQYLASMGPLALAGAGVAWLGDRAQPQMRWMVSGFYGAVVLLYATLSWHRAWIFSSSERLWADTLAKNPGSWVAHYNLGDALTARGETAAALVEFQAALDLRPIFPEAYNRIGEKLAQAGKMDEAISCFHQVLTIAPGNYDTQWDLGNALMQKGKVDEAILCYRNALKIKTDDDWTHIDLGVALAQEGHLDEAIAEYRKGLALNPGVAMSHFNFANALAQRGRTDEAISEYERTLALDPNYAEAHVYLGLALTKKGDVQGAAGQFAAELQINSGDAKEHFKLGNLLLSARQFEAAIAQYQAALRIEPNSAKTHNNLGIAFALSGQASKAVSEFELAVKLAPDYAEAYRNLAMAKAAAAK
jgi:tetratricopeptide (TPR) repeat protein